MADTEIQTVLVSGPVSYSVLSYIEDGYNDLIVHNFGDKHVRHTECNGSSKKLQEVMDDTFKYYQEHHPDEKIDVFIEGGSYYLDKKDDNYLKELLGYYSECYNPHTEPTKLFERDKLCDDKYPNVRFHLIDLRKIIANKLFDVDILRSVIFPNNEDNLKLQIFIKNFLKKQINKIKNAVVKDKIYKIYYDFFKKTYSQYLPELMDIYLLSRLFRTYETAPIKNVIIYSGTEHMLNYNKFFRELENASVKICFREKDLDKNWLYSQCVAVKLKYNSLQFNRKDIKTLDFDGYIFSTKSTGPFFKQKDHDKVAFFQKYTKSIDTLLEFMKSKGLNVQLKISQQIGISEQDISLVVTDGNIYGHFDTAKFKDSKTPALIDIDDIIFEMTNTAIPVFRAKKSRKKSKKRSIRLQTLKNIKNRSSKKRSK